MNSSEIDTLLRRFVERMSRAQLPLATRDQTESRLVVMQLFNRESTLAAIEDRSEVAFLKSLWIGYKPEEWEFGDLEWIPPRLEGGHVLQFMQVVQFVIAVDMRSRAVCYHVEDDIATALEVAPSLPVYIDTLATLAEKIAGLPDDFDSRREEDRRRKDQILLEVLDVIGVTDDSDAGQFWLNLV